jgi:predicted transcriptional regulator
MIFTIVLVIVSIAMFSYSVVMFGRTKAILESSKSETAAIQKTIDDNIKLSKQLYKLYSALQQNQTLQMKAIEVMSKHQKLTAADLNELREQVSNALVAIVQQMSNDGTVSTNIKFKDGKIKLN